MVAPAGTGALMLVALQLVGDAVVPLNRKLFPVCAPKFEPVTVTEVPTGPEAGDKLVMIGAWPGDTNVTAVLRPRPPGAIALTVTRYVPGANALKNVVRSTVLSPLASKPGLPRSEEAMGDAVFGSDPFANTSRR